VLAAQKTPKDDGVDVKCKPEDWYRKGDGHMVKGTG